MIAINAGIAWKDISDGVKRKMLATGGSMMSVQLQFLKGAVGALHHHPHEQIGYVVSGSFEFTMAGEKTVIKAGDSYYVAPSVEHGVVALEDSVLLDVFTPQRQDFYS